VRRLRVIINADDFGASRAVNDAVIEAFCGGVLTSCSLMASGDAFDDAVRRARKCPQLGVGLHLVAVHGRSVLPHREIPSLVDRFDRFSDDPARAGLRYFFSRRARRELRREFIAQFEKALSASISLSHIDAHLHLQVHPVIFDLAVDLGKHYGVRRMRVPEDDLSLARQFEPHMPPGRSVEARIFKILTRRMKKRLKTEGFAFTDRVYGHCMTGKMSEAYLMFLIDHLNAATNEIYLHPARYHGPVPLDPSQRQGLREYDALMSPEVSRRLEILGVERVRYCDFSSLTGSGPDRQE
jgi:chitin disaccharide deacetylase